MSKTAKPLESDSTMMGAGAKAWEKWGEVGQRVSALSYEIIWYYHMVIPLDGIINGVIDNGILAACTGPNSSSCTHQICTVLCMSIIPQ